MLFKIATVLSALLVTTNALSLNREGLSRRGAISTAFGISAIVAQAQVASAGTSPPTEEELDRIRLGYKQITYLLDHFEESTTTCRDNGGECKRNAEPIRRVLGLRSTTDPLFQIDKVFVKVKNMDIDSDKLEAFFEASEDWNSAMNMSNSMAFISQFGEYNPGGGKDEVLKFLLEAQIQVQLAKTSLKTIMDCLEISE